MYSRSKFGFQVDIHGERTGGYYPSSARRCAGLVGSSLTGRRNFLSCDFLFWGSGTGGRWFLGFLFRVREHLLSSFLAVRPNWAEGREWVSPVVFSGFALDWRGFYGWLSPLGRSVFPFRRPVLRTQM